MGSGRITGTGRVGGIRAGRRRRGAVAAAAVVRRGDGAGKGFRGRLDRRAARRRRCRRHRGEGVVRTRIFEAKRRSVPGGGRLRRELLVVVLLLSLQLWCVSLLLLARAGVQHGVRKAAAPATIAAPFSHEVRARRHNAPDANWSFGEKQLFRRHGDRRLAADGDSDGRARCEAFVRAAGRGRLLVGSVLRGAAHVGVNKRTRAAIAIRAWGAAARRGVAAGAQRRRGVGGTRHGRDGGPRRRRAVAPLWHMPHAERRDDDNDALT
mmetsp:Transcript_37441/g.115631  ORF Transcript_37441/g.115631 Transcript_37441/m.115631 type:complete len:266 (+) Transcript_37441:1222-2019(+)